MSPVKRNTTLVDAYASLLDNLNSADKLDLISKLAASAESDSQKKKSAFRKAFGAFISEKSAEEIIAEIRDSRVSTRQIEPLSPQNQKKRSHSMVPPLFKTAS
jgi:hypothetical protein